MANSALTSHPCHGAARLPSQLTARQGQRNYTMLPEQPVEAQPHSLLIPPLPLPREAASLWSVTLRWLFGVHARAPLTEAMFGFCQVIPLAQSVPEEHHRRWGDPHILPLFPIFRDRTRSFWSFLISGQTVHPHPDFLPLLSGHVADHTARASCISSLLDIH